VRHFELLAFVYRAQGGGYNVVVTTTETVLVVTPLKVRFVIERDPSGLYVGHIREYPGILTQGRTRDTVRRGLIRLLREIGRDHPRELALFR